MTGAFGVIRIGGYEPPGVLYIAVGAALLGYCIYVFAKRFSDKKRGGANTYEKLLASLSQGARRIEADGLAIELRDCSDRVAGKLDPRTETAGKLTRENFHKNRASLDPRLLKNEIHLFGPEQPERFTPLEFLRVQFGWVTEDRSSGVKTAKLSIECDGVTVTAYKYETPSEDANRPCMVFFHGGGFFGGVIATTENQCKLLAELSGAVVISADYPLAPEYPYPAGFNACYETVKWAHKNAGLLGVSRDKIAVSGDSAGGNLALCAALRSRDESLNLIAYMALIYPTVTRAKSPGEEYYYFDKESYDNPFGDEYIAEQIEAIGKSGDSLEKWYIPEGEDPMQPYISPITAPMDSLPQALVITVEYDYLRLECEALSRKLMASGVRARHIRYGGLVHGVFDRLGYAPQVEDMLREIAKDLRRLK